MFQTEINIFIQSFATEALNEFFKFITYVSGETSAITITVIIMFGISFRTGFLLMHVGMYSAGVNEILKEVFTLPKPLDVDANVRILGKNKTNKTPLISMGAKHFWAWLPQQTIDYFKVHNLGSFGFPSGHATRAISFWGMIFMLYKKVWVRVISVLFIILMPLARIYFGKHFLADVLGSFAVSIVLIGLFYGLIFKNKSVMRFMFDEKGFKVNPQTFLLLIYLFLFPFILVFNPKIACVILGPLLGINAAYLVLRFQGLPNDTGTFRDRMARVLVAGICFLIFMAGPEKIIKGTICMEIMPIWVGLKALGSFLFLWMAVKINRRLGFFKE